MKKVKRRTYLILAPILAIFVFLTIFLFRLAADGETWATFPSNPNIFHGGHLAIGSIYDRNGVLLASAGEQGLEFNANAAIRRANFHVVGDGRGHIGTGALSAYAGALVGYNLITGVYAFGGGGNAIQLTIDAELNRVAYEALAGRRGAVVVMNYQTGEILVSVSAPSYDPANPPSFAPDDPAFEGVYINRVLSAAYVPGSIFKIVTAAASIDTFADAFTREYVCNGYVIIDGNRVTCMGNHGRISLERAMGVSCNPYFAQLAVDLGGNRLRQYTDRFGLLERHSLSGTLSTVPGNFVAGGPGSADLAWSGVGQSENLINPLGLVRFLGAIARGGTPVEPRLIANVSGGLPFSQRTRTGPAIMSARVADQLGTLLRETAIHYYSGSFPGLAVAGKTGTAEIDGQWPHAWFVGFLDDPDNPLAFVVLVEHGGGGLTVAGPVANTVLQAAVRS
ncbi:MAG: penicillin-binding transpeptidase domain-containing protein [Oscillospiraceae bacterium]|nr:penicillin-binding transpeptidase domain-containing protein [Oscillospiraceae bacterium]